ncbi:OB-fold protein [Pusillimonas minor]|uniref:tRNA_anti-like n=1 Tax=Pusillimonas minor TaxID=2697024 RepID=A0A842HSN1_9BURK|nr:hypothetical protein [Pusillimonas minor]MBC2771176.1 hypothetical protein [Pusillimonas minor]
MNDKPKKPIYKRVWFWLVMFFVLPGVISGLTSDKPSKMTGQAEAAKIAAAPDTPSTSSFSAGTNHKYKLSHTEYNVLTVLLEDEVTNFSQGNDAILGKDSNLIRTTGRKLSAAYDANEAAADKEFKGKLLFVTARVESINKGITGSPYFVVSGGFIGAQAHFDRDYNDYAATVAKGETVNLVCEGNGYIITSAMLDDCVPAIDFAKRESQKLIKEAGRFLAGYEVSKTAQNLIFGSLAIAKVIPEAQCEQPNKQCLAAAKKAGNDKNKLNAAMDQTIEQLKTAGVNLDDPRKSGK